MNMVVGLNKKDLLNKLLQNSKVMVTFDVQTKGVDVPDFYKKEVFLKVNLSYNFGKPITLTDWGVEATLTFDNVQYNVKIPWNSIVMYVPYDTNIPYMALDQPLDKIDMPAPTPQQEIKPGKPKFTVIKGEKL